MFEKLFRKKVQEEKESPKREIVEQTDNGFWLRQVEKDERGRLIYERKREFRNPSEPKENDIKYDYEKRFEYDDEGNLVEEEGKSFDHENGWKKSFEWKEGKIVREAGEIIEGPNQDHKWTKKFQYNEKGNMVLEEGEILEQGENPNKPLKGHAWQTKHFYKNKKWIGEAGEITAGPEKGKIWTKGKVSEEDLKNL